MITPASFQACAERAAAIAKGATFSPAVLITQTADCLEIRTATSEAEYVAKMPPVDAAPLRVAVPPVELVKALAAVGGVADIAHKGARLSISAGGTTVNIPTLSPDDIPEFSNTGDDVTAFDVDLGDLNGILQRVAYALPAKDHRQVLMGVCIDIKDMTLTATAADGKKLALAALPLSEVTGPDGRWVISRTTLDAIAGMTGNASVEMSGIATAISRERDGLLEYLTVINIAGKYPDCSAVIPPPANTVKIDTNALASVVKGGKHFCDSTQKVVLDITEDKMEIRAFSHDKGEFLGSIPLTDSEFTGEIAANASFLLETLARFDGDAALSIADQRRPVVFTDPATGREHGLCLLMPIKLPPVVAAADEEGEE